MRKATAITATILLSGLGLSACGRSGAADPRLEAPLVRTVVVGVSADAGEQLTGTVKARVESDLGFREAGKIAERLVDPGQSVRKGQPLMRLDPSDYVSGVAAAEANYAAAKAQAERAAADELRLRGLVKSGAVSVQTYDQAKAGADSALEQMKAAAAQRDVARRQGGYAVLTADADGVVMTLSAEVGQVVAAGQPVLRLAHDGDREAVVNVPETRRESLARAASARLFTASGAAVPARLRQLAAAADPFTRTFEARYVLEGEGRRAPLGTTVTVTWPSAGRHGGAGQVSAPLTALIDRGGGSGVFVVDPVAQVVHLRSVTIAALGEEDADLSSGVKPGERIVSLGVLMLHDGQRVRIEPAR